MWVYILFKMPHIEIVWFLEMELCEGLRTTSCQHLVKGHKDLMGCLWALLHLNLAKQDFIILLFVYSLPWLKLLHSRCRSIPLPCVCVYLYICACVCVYTHTHICIYICVAMRRSNITAELTRAAVQCIFTYSSQMVSLCS